MIDLDEIATQKFTRGKKMKGCRINISVCCGFCSSDNNYNFSELKNLIIFLSSIFSAPHALVINKKDSTRRKKSGT